MNAAQHRMLGRALVSRVIDRETGDAIVAGDGLDAPIRSEIEVVLPMTRAPNPRRCGRMRSYGWRSSSNGLKVQFLQPCV